MKPLDQFLVEFDQQLSTLNAVDAALVREEVLAHLDASIQARLELGDSPVQAEVNAIRALGATETFIPKLPCAKPPLLDWRVIAAAASLSVLWFVGAQVPSGGALFSDAFFFSLIVLSAWVIAASLRARRFQGQFLAAVVVAITMMSAVPASMRYASVRSFPLEEIRQADRGRLHVASQQLYRDAARLEELSNLIARNPSAFNADRKQIAFSFHDSAMDSTEDVTRYGVHLGAAEIVRRMKLNAENYEAASKRPWFVELGHQLLPCATSIILVIGPIAYAFALHTIAFPFGAMIRRSHRRRDPNLNA